MPIGYLKMNGLGNDFVVVDARESGRRFSAEEIRAVADRQTGIGCDQFIVMEKAKSDASDVFMRIFNQSGEEVEACGNATRCIAALVAEEAQRTAITVETVAGQLFADVNGDMASVDMGRPRFGWDEIPLAEEFHDTTGIELQIGPIDAPVLHTPSVANIGNPHAVFWVKNDPDSYDLHLFGPLLENHPLFPERANISIAQIVGEDHIKLRTWERGAGLTRACGTAACAAGVCAARKELTGRSVRIDLPGGMLRIDWRDSDDHIIMTGPWSRDAQGTLPETLVAETGS